ncbi:MAG: hypothetical protein D6734_00210 [Candidatus Schekmanbacteria bacterium]|nr:MAG: hypothetical protein D6734_00210 [Candidatus Schekmanbacteria bacterium]
MSVEMTHKEIEDLMSSEKVGTLLLVDGDRPYGVVCWFVYDNGNIRIGIMPSGRKYECIKSNNNAAFSVWRAGKGGWRSVLVEGKIRQVTDIDELRESLELAAEKYGVPSSYIDKQVAMVKENPEKSMSFVIEAEDISGRKSG